MTLRSLIHFFIKYKYQAIIPIAILEGPIISIISGFLVSRGVLDLMPAFAIVFLGDVISDTAFYFIGRGGRHMIGYFKFVYISEERMIELESHFKQSPWRTMIAGKVSYGLGAVFMIASGAAHMPIIEFIEYVLSLNFVRSAILLAIGYYFGRTALHLGPTALKYYATFIIVLVPTLYFFYRNKFIKKI